MTHRCVDCGFEHEPVMVEEPAEPVVEVDPEPIAAAEVQIEAIRADRDVQVAKIEARVAESELAGQVAELQGVVAGMAETLKAMTPPPPEPVPVPVEPEPIPEPVPEPVAPPAPVEPSAPAKRRGNAFWR